MTQGSRNPVDLLHQDLERLDEVRGPNSSGRYTTRCASLDHPDQNPSMSVSEKGYHCFSCGHQGSLSKLANELGIEVPKDSAKGRRSLPEGAGLTLAELAKAKGLNAKHLANLGWVDATSRGRAVVKIPYSDPGGRAGISPSPWDFRG